jgi:outer membrane protein OmpA-like peptidoglycan-associated protein
MPPQPGSEATAPTPPVLLPDMVELWEGLKGALARKNADTLGDIASLVDSGARLLQPLLEKTGETASQALELGKAFFQHFAESAGDEAGKRTVDAVFDYFSGKGNAATPATDPKRATRTFSVQRGIVRFDIDRSVLPPSGQATINSLVAASPRARTFWLIVGSTDRSGSEARNTTLAKERVDTVAAYLKARGIDQRLIIQRPLSELAAPVPGYDGGRDPENRRTEIFLLIVNPG